jgi:transcriptional regulator with XRE-family HTH domain
MSKTKMNQAVLRDEREARGLTKTQMIDVLGLDGVHAEQILTDFESGFRQPKAAVLRIYESLNRQRWCASGLLGLPAWSLSDGGRVVHHNEWPRFVGMTIPEQEHAQQWQFRKTEMPAFILNGAGGMNQIIFTMIDHLPDDFDAEDLFSEAVRLVEERLKDGGD